MALSHLYPATAMKVYLEVYTMVGRAPLHLGSNTYIGREGFVYKVLGKVWAYGITIDV